MKKKIVDLLYKTKGDFSPSGLQKVFFSFHPEDSDKMEQVVIDVLSMANCAAFFHHEEFNDNEIDLDDYSLRLQEMKLFIVIITTNYLSKDSFAKNWEYRFAVENNIPILPIAVETDIETFFR